MDLTKTWFAGITFALVATAALAGNALAQQGWQEKSRADDGPVQASWEDRVLRRPQPAQQSLNWLAADGSSQRQGRAEATFQRTAYVEPSARPQQAARRASYERYSLDSVAPPARVSRSRAMLASNEETVDSGTVQFEPVAQPDDGFVAQGGGAGCGAFGDDCGGCGVCDACCTPCDDGCDYGWEVFDGRCGPWLRGLSVFAGADAFRSPINRDTTGNYGFNEGVNLSRPLGDPWGCGYQIGANFVQSDFSSATDDAGMRTLPFRKQYFATAGIYRRADACGGFQWGLAYDYLHDIYYQSADLQQLRSETSFVLDDVYTIGYYGVYGVGGNQLWTNRQMDGKLDPTDMFVLYVRKNFENGGDGRIWAGGTGNGDGLVGVDLWVPLGKSFALENRVNYLIPNGAMTGNRDTAAEERASWGFVVQLVWYPGQNAKCQRGNPYRPMFNVADNSLFMVDRLAR